MLKNKKEISKNEEGHPQLLMLDFLLQYNNFSPCYDIYCQTSTVIFKTASQRHH